MKYLILIDKKFPYKSGESFLESEIPILSKHFDKILIYPLDISKDEVLTRKIKQSNVNVFKINRIPKNILRYWYIIIVLIRQLLKLQFKNFEENYLILSANNFLKKVKRKLEEVHFETNDEIVIYSYWLYETAFVACCLKGYFLEKGYKNTKAVSRAHRFDIYEEIRASGKLPFRNFLLQELDLIVSISEDGEKYLTKKYPEFDNKIITSKLGTFDNGSQRINSTKLNKFQILSISRITKIKRIHKIAEAISLLPKNIRENCIWTHIGDGPEKDLVREVVNKTNLIENVEFLGYMKNTDVYEYLKNNKVDVFINVSSSEGIPVSIMEVASFGIPIIATRVGGTSEIVKNELNGFLIEENFTNQTLSDIIQKIYLLDDMTVKQLRSGSRSIWSKYFDANKNYTNFAKILLKKEDKV